MGAVSKCFTIRERVPLSPTALSLLCRSILNGKQPHAQAEVDDTVLALTQVQWEGTYAAILITLDRINRRASPPDLDQDLVQETAELPDKVCNLTSTP